MQRLLALCILALLAFSGARAADAVFIAHPDVKAADLSAAEVKSILLGAQTTWAGGGNLVLCVQAGGPAHEAVLKTYVERSADQFDKYWKKLVFTGKGSSPEIAADDAAAVAFVARTPGAFGYVSAGASPPGVKILPLR